MFASGFAGRAGKPTTTGTGPVENPCGATGRATAGPFYISSSPTTHRINYKNLPGTAMRISGTVYGGKDMQTPLPNAQVEIWHADDSGGYHPEEDGDIREFKESEICLRGIQFTDAEGKFSFESIVPGLYGNRRRHLHWKVMAEGHEPITTQSYWLSEKDSAQDRRDFTDRNAEECRYVDFRKNSEGVWVGEFEVVLV